MDFDALYKVILIGDSGVGKSSLLQRFIEPHGALPARGLPTIGVDFRILTKEYGGKRVKLQIWDTAGQERFRTIASSYYRGAHLIVIVADLTDPASITNVGAVWVPEVRKYALPSVKHLLLMNKVDAPRATDQCVRVAEVAAQTGFPMVYTSAGTGEGVSEAFETALQELARIPLADDKPRVHIQSQALQRNCCRA